MAGYGKIMAHAGAALLIGLTGCGKKPADKSDQPAPPVLAISGGNSATGEVQAPPVYDPRLHQPFAEATTDEPPPGWQRPPDTTLTGKATGKLFLEVAHLWDEIKFVSPTGQPLTYRAILDTEMGPIGIELWPHVAPNHVRNFVALARAGYYDGLVFERTINEIVAGESEAKLQMIEAGCPLGTGDLGYGSIGYWVKPELNPDLAHEEGTLAACHGSEEELGNCKFYINLCKAPYLDGQDTVFGKVYQGLDVAQKILTIPVRNDAEHPEGDRPAKPVVIRKITIESK